ncbi:DUF4403 family protein [Agrobacterium vitis]
MSKLLFSAVALGVLAGGWVAYDWYQSREIKMSERPSKASTEAVYKPRESVVLANLVIGYPVIEKALNDAVIALPHELSNSAELKCVSNDWPRFRECLTVNWLVNYDVNGRISVSRDGDKVRITVPGKFNGHAGFGGEIAKALKLDKKDFNGAFTASVSASLALDPHFCPVVIPGDVSFGWENEGRVEMIGRSDIKLFGIKFGSFGPWNLEIGRHFNGEIRDALRNALTNATNAIPCDKIQAELKEIWRNYAVPVSIENAPPLFINIEPNALGTSGVIAEDASVRVVARIAANVNVSTIKGSEDLKPDLPVHTEVMSDDGSLDVAIPLRMPYDVMRSQALKAIGDAPFSVRSDAGEISVKVDDLEIFPSNENLAVGVHFSADLPWHLFDASGVVWITGKPVVEDNGKVVRLENLKVTRQIDNSLWELLSVAFQDVLHAKITEAAIYNLTPLADTAIKNVREAISDPSKTGNVHFELLEADISLGEIVPEEDVLNVEGKVKARWNASLEPVTPEG